MNLDIYNNKTILLFGKSRAFSKEEFKAQLKVHNITLVEEVNDAVSLVIDGRMMTPYEEKESQNLYALNKYEFISIEKFEALLAMHLDEDSLLMSLKLSGDKVRLKSFIQNTTMSNTLFFKLIKMYHWGEDDFFENDDNRDVSAAFISRFYENIEQNHNVQYATTGFVHLIKQTNNTALLESIFSLQPIKKNQKMLMQLAINKHSSAWLLNKLFKDGDYEIKLALSTNENLPFEIVKKFVEDEKLGLNVAKNILLNEEYFAFLQEYQQALSLNKSLTHKMQVELLHTEDKEIEYALALNDNIALDILEQLLTKEDALIHSALYQNKAMPSERLQEAYVSGKYFLELAKNENTPVDILYQLHLDARYERAVKTNASFGRSIKEKNIGWL